MNDEPTTALVISDRAHGRYGYSQGCRCLICRDAAKAAARRRRQTHVRARQDFEAKCPGFMYVVPNVTHGLHGYNYHQCRCVTCRHAKMLSQRRYRANRRDRNRELAAGA